MGGSGSKPEEPPSAPATGGFSVHMTPALLQRAGESSAASSQLVTATRGELEEQLQLAFQQGAEYAANALREEQARHTRLAPRLPAAASASCRILPPASCVGRCIVALRQTDHRPAVSRAGCGKGKRARGTADQCEGGDGPEGGGDRRQGGGAARARVPVGADRAACPCGGTQHTPVPLPLPSALPWHTRVSLPTLFGPAIFSHRLPAPSSSPALCLHCSSCHRRRLCHHR